MITAYDAKRYLEHKKVYQATYDNYKESEQTFKTAMDAWEKSREQMRLCVPDEQLDKIVIQVLQDDIAKNAQTAT